MRMGRIWSFGMSAALLLQTLAVDVTWAQQLPRASTPESVGFSSERLKRLEAEMARIVSAGEVKGVAAMLARHGKVVWQKTNGNRTDKDAMTRDTIFRLASMTKPVTGVGLMILFEEGRFRLDDPITKFIPEFARLQVANGVDGNGNIKLVPMKRPPTMRELMSHTAGLGYGMFQDTPADKLFAQTAPLAAGSMKEMIERMAKVPLLYQPGEHFSYSAAIDVQGYIIEKLSGMRLGEFLQQRVFTPLKMTDTGFVVPAAKIGRLAAMYSTNAATGALVPAAGGFGGRSADPSKQPAIESGGGGLFSTLDDYARFAQMLANKGVLDGVRLLAPATVELMQSNSFPDPLPPGFVLTLPWMFSNHMGFGLNMQTAVNPRAAGRMEGVGTLSWDGATGVWRWVDPANDLFFIGMIQNSSRTGPRYYGDITRQLVYSALVEPGK